MQNDFMDTSVEKDPKADGTDVAPGTPAGWITARAGTKKMHLIRKGNTIKKIW